MLVRAAPISLECRLLNYIRGFPKWKGNSLNLGNSRNLINFWSMNWGHLKNHVCYLCVADSVVTSWSLTQEVASSNNIFYKYWIQRIQWKHLRKTQLCRVIKSGHTDTWTETHTRTQIPIFSINRYTRTRMHASRMRTNRSSSYWVGGGEFSPGGSVSRMVCVWRFLYKGSLSRKGVSIRRDGLCPGGGGWGEICVQGGSLCPDWFFV